MKPWPIVPAAFCVAAMFHAALFLLHIQPAPAQTPETTRISVRLDTASPAPPPISVPNAHDALIPAMTPVQAPPTADDRVTPAKKAASRPETSQRKRETAPRPTQPGKRPVSPAPVTEPKTADEQNFAAVNATANEAPAVAAIPALRHRQFPVAALPSAPTQEAGQTREEYLSIVSATLEKHKAYPLVARRRNLQGIAMVRLRIDAGGHAVASGLEGSSGHATLDQAVLDMLAKAKSFPTPPNTGSGGTFDCLVPVRFTLQ